MRVKLLSCTPDPDLTVATAARVCYRQDSIEEICKKLLKNSTESNKSYIEELFEKGHQSPFEHISFTFSIEDVSRALSHQLVRHRIASYSQKSQRYVSETMFGFVTPPKIATDAKALAEYNGLMEKIQETYSLLTKAGIPKEDARYVLPNATCTSLMVTMNARSLFNFFGHRCCMRAQWEIRQMARQMLQLVKEAAPMVFSHAGANCEMLGYCPECKGGCGAKPTLAEVMSGYEDWKQNNKNNKEGI